MNFLFLAIQETPVEEINFGMLILKMLFFLGLVVALIYFILRKVLPLLIHGTALKTRSVKIIERIPVDQRRSLLVAEIQDKVYLLGSAEGQINVLMELDADKLQAKPSVDREPSTGFDQVLKKSLIQENFRTSQALARSLQDPNTPAVMHRRCTLNLIEFEVRACWNLVV